MQGPVKDMLRVSMVPRWALPPGRKRNAPRIVARTPILDSRLIFGKLILGKTIMEILMMLGLFKFGGHLTSGPLEAAGPICGTSPVGRCIATEPGTVI